MHSTNLNELLAILETRERVWMRTKISENNVDEAREWCNSNCRDEYRIIPSSWEEVAIAKFRDEQDFILFSLKWSN